MPEPGAVAFPEIAALALRRLSRKIALRCRPAWLHRETLCQNKPEPWVKVGCNPPEGGRKGTSGGGREERGRGGLQQRAGPDGLLRLPGRVEVGTNGGEDVPFPARAGEGV